jgi:soluble lytic murein transglycosylase
VKEEFWFSAPENLVWERYQVLVKAGWFEEAQFELQALPEPQSPAAEIVMGRLWGLAMDYSRAITLVNDAWDKDANLRMRSVIEMIFPKEYKNYVLRETKSSGLAPNLIFALMRQESSFRPQVVSGSGARGVMQLMEPTARDMLDAKQKKSFTADDLLDPEVSIRLGVKYLARLKRNYSGNLPLAFAAYNAGIGKMNRWLGSRELTSGLKGSKTSDPFTEIWVDELPWDETSDYVKSVLRNYLIYQMLDQGELALKDPLWLPSDS